MSASVEIKGIRDGLLATLPPALAWEEVLNLLRERLDQQPQFFKGARLSLELGTRTLRVNELIALRDELSERGIALWAILSESPTTIKNAQLLGLATRLGKPRPATPLSAEIGEGALWIERTLRSGVKIEHSGPVVIVGDVNPGAEIVTSSSLLVWGRLRGRIFAGQGKNTEAFICALRFQTTQATLAGVLLSAPPTTERPLKVFLENGLPRWETWE
ncbi:MAG: septum site-determining protein MinC [Anaerolineales bacterium]